MVDMTPFITLAHPELGCVVCGARHYPPAAARLDLPVVMHVSKDPRSGPARARADRWLDERRYIKRNHDPAIAI